MREPFGAEFQCQVNGKHKINLYFFDSQPSEHKCPQCDDGTMMRRVRVIDMKKTASIEGLKKHRDAEKRRL